MVFIPVGKYTATAAAKAWIPVLCEHCGSMFGYLTTQEAEGTGSSPLWLDNEGAAERARKAAASSLHRKLKKANDPVPCPRCVRYQTKMTRALRRGFLLKGIWIGLATGFLWFLWILFTWDPPARSFWQTGSTGAPLILAAVAAGAVLWGVIRAVRLDPDAYAQSHMPPKDNYLPMTAEQYRQIRDVGYVVTR